MCILTGLDWTPVCRGRGFFSLVDRLYTTTLLDYVLLVLGARRGEWLDEV